MLVRLQQARQRAQAYPKMVALFSMEKLEIVTEVTSTVILVSGFILAGMSSSLRDARRRYEANGASEANGDPDKLHLYEVEEDLEE